VPPAGEDGRRWPSLAPSLRGGPGYLYRAGPGLALAPSPTTCGPLAGGSAGAVGSGPGPPSGRTDAEKVSPGGRRWGLARPDLPAGETPAGCLAWLVRSSKDPGLFARACCLVGGPAVSSRWTRQLGSDYCLASGQLEGALTTPFLAHLAANHLPALAPAALQHAVARGEPSGRSGGVRAPRAGPPYPAGQGYPPSLY
jgi:hypothetical protein